MFWNRKKNNEIVFWSSLKGLPDIDKSNNQHRMYNYKTILIIYVQ